MHIQTAIVRGALPAWSIDRNIHALVMKNTFCEYKRTLTHNTQHAPKTDMSKGLSLRWGIAVNTLDEWITPRKIGEHAEKLIPAGSTDVAGGIRTKFSQKGLYAYNTCAAVLDGKTCILRIFACIHVRVDSKIGHI